MCNRPLIPVLIAFAGGIFFVHRFMPGCRPLIIPALTALSLLLIGIFWLPRPSRYVAFILIIFLAGIYLDIQQHRPSLLNAPAAGDKKVTVEGTLLEPVRLTDNVARMKVRTRHLTLEGDISVVAENILVTVYDHIPSLTPGDVIRFPARLRPFRNFRNPGAFDYEAAMTLTGLSCAASVSDGRRIVPIGSGSLPFPQGALEAFRRPVRDFLISRLAPQDAALFRAFILGERQGIHRDLREHFNRTGLGHMLAVSGLHIGLVAWVSFFLFKGVLSRSYRLGLGTDIRRLAALLTCLPVVGYTLLSGFQVSGQRAMIMALAFLLSLVLGREKDVWSTFALAGLVILAINPHALFSMSFQLSFAAVTGILWLTPHFLKRIPQPAKTSGGARKLLRSMALYFIGLCAVCLSATIFLLPIISFYFHRISILSLPANLTVLPILGLWVLPSGLLSACTLPLAPSISNMLLQVSSWGLHLMMGIIRFWSHFTWSHLWVLTPNIMEILAFYGFLLFLSRIKGRTWAKMGLTLLLIFAIGDAAYWIYTLRFDKNLRVRFLDVGQANAALVRFPSGKNMLIDGGGFPRDHFDVGQMVVAPSLWRDKIGRLDYIVLSHPQADHMNGLRFIAGAFRPSEFWYNGLEPDSEAFRKLMAIIDAMEIKKYGPCDLAGGRVINGARVEVLHPISNAASRNMVNTTGGINNASLVLKISYAGKSFLFPGDLEREGEKVLVADKGESLKSDILLSPHHGSRSSSSVRFLEKVRPRICVVSSGADNFFGFPHMQTLKRLDNLGCRIIRIDREGAADFTVGPNVFEVETFRENEK